MRITVACGASLFFCVACQSTAPAVVEAPADPAAGTVEFEWAGPNEAAMVVQVHLNGAGPYPFVLDTGATLTCVDQRLAEELGLPEASGRIGVGAGIGGPERMRLIRIDSLRVGEARVERLPGCALDLAATQRIGIEFDGLLGLNFLRSFHLTIDFERSELTLREL